MNVLEQIRNRLDDLPQGQRAIAEMILNDYRQVANLSAAELAGRAGVSDATVVRFAQSIGYAGFTEIKDDLFLLLAHEPTPAEKMIETISSQKAIDSKLASVFENDIRNIEDTFRDISEEDLHKAAELIRNSPRVYVVGINSCASLAHFLSFHLNRLSRDTALITSAGLVLFEQLAPISAEDALVIISFPRYSRDSLNAIRMARQRGAPTVLVTDRPYTPLSRHSDLILVAKSSNLAGFYNSYAAAITLLNAVIISVAMLDKDGSLDALRKLDSIKEEFDFYL